MNCEIPKHFHFIWIGTKMPEEYAIFYENWKTLHPTFKFTLWSETEILQEKELVEELKKIQSVYEKPDGSVLPIERITFAVFTDIIRYYLLFKYGGIYVDMDADCIKPIDELLPLCNKECSILINSTNDLTHFKTQKPKLITNNPCPINNNFIISPQNNKFFEMIFRNSIDRVLQVCNNYIKTGVDDLDNLPVPFSENPASVCGPWWLFSFVVSEPTCIYRYICSVISNAIFKNRTKEDWKQAFECRIELVKKINTRNVILKRSKIIPTEMGYFVHHGHSGRKKSKISSWFLTT